MTAINKVEYHRNGVGGRGFYVALVTDPFGNHDMDDDGEFVVIMFPEYNSETDEYVVSHEYTAVLHLGMLADRCIEFGENSWRGDRAAGACGDMILAAAKAQLEASWAAWAKGPDEHV